MRSKADAGAVLDRDARSRSCVVEVTMRVCIVGASGKLGKYMVEHALDRGYEVVGVCCEQSVAKLDAYEGGSRS
jgi:hypothetical protein